MYYTTTYPSPLGILTLACDGSSLVGLWLEGQKHFAETLTGEVRERQDLPVFAAAAKWLDRYFAGQKPASAELPLAPSGSEFRLGVWALLRDIPYGTVTTYGDLAYKMAARGGKGRVSARAVGGAVGHNPLSIIIPCHRVTGANGSLTGYAGGIAAKKKLLEWEGVDMTHLFVP